MADLPSGTVTFLFTDIEGSTPLWEQQPRAVKAALALHHRILRQAIGAHHGHIFTVAGDAFCAAFATAASALAAALDAQSALADAAWGETPLRVRMGLHTGTAEVAGGDYQSGPTLNRVSRVMARAHGGQILLSQPTAELLRGQLPDGVALREVDSRRLKGMERPERLYRIVPAEQPDDSLLTPAPQPAEARSQNAQASERSIVSPLLIGRALSLQALEQRVEQVRHGTGQIVLIAGEAGIGKSRLVSEVKAAFSTASRIASNRTVAADRQRILQGRCFEHDRSLPYAPLLDLLRLYLGARPVDELEKDLGSAASELVKLLPELLARLPDLAPSAPLDSELEKRRLFEALAQFFLGLAGERPLLMVIEDIHWSDDTSLECLLYLAHRIGAQPILLLLTYRNDEVHASLSHWLAELNRERLASELVLSRLSRAEVDALVQAVFELKQPVNAEFLEPLYTLTEGNPFFVEEVLKSLLAAGDIFFAGGQWTRRPMSEVRIPHSVQDAVQRRVQPLSEGARQVLTLAAVAGRRFDFALLQQVAGLTEVELLAHMKEMMAAQLVVEDSAETFAFRHALTRQAVYGQLLARERKSLHRMIGETLERMDGAVLETRAVDLAYHFAEAGEWPKALAYERRAAEQAERVYAHEEALRHYERARSIAERLQQPEQAAAIEEAIGDVHDLQGSQMEAAEHYERALTLNTTPRERAVLKAKAGKAYLWISGNERGVAYLQAALDELDPETQAHELCETIMMLGRSHWYRSEYTRAIEFYERARVLAEPLGDTVTLATIYNLLSSAHSVLLHLDESTDWAHKAVATGQRAASPLAVAVGYLFLGQSASMRGAWQDALRYAEQNKQLSQQVGSDRSRGWAEYQRSIALQQQGELLAAEEAAHAALGAASETAEPRLSIDTLSPLSTIECDIGKFVDARAHAELALAQADELGQRLLQCGARWALAYFHIENKEWRQAVERFDQCAELRAGTEERGQILSDGADSATAYIGMGRLDEASKVIGEVLAIAREAKARHYEAVARRVQGQICTARHQWREARLAFDEAVTMLDENGSRLELARALYHRGDMHQAMQNRDAAREDWTHAAQLCEQMGAKPMLWRTHAALGQLARAEQRADDAEREFLAARGIVDDLAAHLQDEALREQLLERAAKVIPRLKPLTPRRAVQREFGGLTAREREIATLIAKGKTSREIAAELVLSERTVEGHVGNILNKLTFTSRAQIAAWAVEKGLVKG